jgi:hypothetical protein
MLFLVRVRVNVSRMTEFGQTLESGQLDRSAVKATYCLREEPAVGMGMWDVVDEEELERKLGPWRRYYESVEIQQVVTPNEAMALLSQRSQER